ncbi:hypothetical protein [uncultured Serinicoccus sp.]|uniref:hypothetical protein n=1 Tax=uncultured Serinicoccus sp. TaxID=735514 RepID=UPI00262E3464|nr:hypothetical protein [uncultured Serinicoccus sp.]
MSARLVWACAITCMLVGVALGVVLGVSEGSARIGGEVSSALLVIAPLGLAVNITARRRRANRGEDSHDSVEFQAAVSARSAAFGDALLLSALAMLALTIAPGALPMLWALLLVVTMVTAFWLRYAAELRRLRG